MLAIDSGVGNKVNRPNWTDRLAGQRLQADRYVCARPYNVSLSIARITIIHYSLYKLAKLGCVLHIIILYMYENNSYNTYNLKWVNTSFYFYGYLDDLTSSSVNVVFFVLESWGVTWFNDFVFLCGKVLNYHHIQYALLIVDIKTLYLVKVSISSTRLSRICSFLSEHIRSNGVWSSVKTEQNAGLQKQRKRSGCK